MNAFWLSALFGALITAVIFSAVASNIKGKKALCALFIFILIAMCAASVWLVIYKYSEHLIYCFCGLAVGIPFFAIFLHIAITYFGDRIIKLFKKMKKPNLKRKKQK